MLWTGPPGKPLRSGSNSPSPTPSSWWPSQYGEQNLYWLELELTGRDGQTVDSAATSFGIRTIEMAPTPNGERKDQYNWTFVINGEPLFLKGTGWCTIDALMRFTEERYDSMLSRAKEQGVQLLRAWGGGMPETDTFYDLCDAYGICVYQEWPTAWDSYKSQPEDILCETVEHNVRRLRNRPSLLMWGGGNEGKAPLEEPVLNAMGRLTLENDGTRPWHRQDMYGYNSTHNYDTYWGNQELDRYLQLYDGFIGEFGLASLPNMESIRKYATEEEIQEWPISAGSNVNHHTPIFGTAQAYWGSGDIAIISHFAEKFLKLNSVEDLVMGSQLAQAVGIRHTLERARTRWPDSTGICYYKLNDVYPAASWATVDWYGSPKIGHYLFQDAYQPLAAVGLISKTNSYGEALSVPVWLLDDRNELKDASWRVNVRAYGGALT